MLLLLLLLLLMLQSTERGVRNCADPCVFAADPESNAMERPAPDAVQSGTIDPAWQRREIGTTLNGSAPHSGPVALKFSLSTRTAATKIQWGMCTKVKRAFRKELSACLLSCLMIGHNLLLVSFTVADMNTENPPKAKQTRNGNGQDLVLGGAILPYAISIRSDLCFFLAFLLSCFPSFFLTSFLLTNPPFLNAFVVAHPLFRPVHWFYSFSYTHAHTHSLSLSLCLALRLPRSLLFISSLSWWSLLKK